MSKKKNTFKRKGRKEAFKYIKKQLENSIVLDSAQVLYDYNQFEAREFIRCLFGDKDGNKLIDIIDDMPNDDDEDEVGGNYISNSRVSHTYPRLIVPAIENNDIKSLSFKIAMTSPYFEDNDNFTISENELKLVNTLDNLCELIYIKVFRSVSYLVECSNKAVLESNLPEFIKDDYNNMLPVNTRDYRMGVRILIGGIKECIESMISNTESCVAAETGVAYCVNATGLSNAMIYITEIEMSFYDASDSEIQKTVNPAFISRLLPKELTNMICNSDYETVPYLKIWNADDAPIHGKIIAFTASIDCKSSNGNTIHVGLLTDASCKEDKPLAILVPSCMTKIYTTQTACERMLLSEFKKDSIIIDNYTMFYPIKNGDDIFYKYYIMSSDEAGMVADIVSDIEPGKFFTSGDYPETQEKINTLLKMLQKVCPDVDFKAHDITLVDDCVVYDDTHALNCIDVALTDTTEE